MNRPILSCFERHHESEVSCIVFSMKISFHLIYANKTNFHMKSFGLSTAFVTRDKATRKWPILICGQNHVKATFLYVEHRIQPCRSVQEHG